MINAKNAVIAASFLIFSIPAIVNAGEMLRSDRDLNLPMNAVGGAKEGAAIELNNQCASTNPDCTWTFQNGMIVSDRNPALALNALTGAREGADIIVTATCTPANKDCTWRYAHGMLLSDRNPSLAINASGGARQFGPLKLTAACTASNPDCTWTIARNLAAPPQPTGHSCQDCRNAFAICQQDANTHGGVIGACATAEQQCLQGCTNP